MVDYISGWCKSKRRLDGWTMIVTGANTGIGKETALEFYKRGARVIMACRDVSKAKEAKQDMEKSAIKDRAGELVVEKLDLCSLRSVREFSARVTSSERCVRTLVCNAGVMMCPEGRTEDGFETHIGSNHLAHALLTLLLLPVMVKAPSARIVFVSSVTHHFQTLQFEDLNYKHTPYSSVAAYINSKIANVLFAKALALKLKENKIDNVTTYSLHPGIVWTGIDRHLPTNGFFWNLIDRLFQNSLLRWCWKTPQCGAQTSIYCAIDENCEHESGHYYSDCGRAWTMPQCRSEKKANQLWDITINMLKLKDDLFKLAL